ncbi:RNA ligase family protein [Oscillibacter sp.]|uniref:ATP-dependent DNA ligase n=1 Tax=Oscillibacter sp. TaxID=1945593 RepID=UPI0028A0923D|nr:RNA ligase family protein [Oscillibacter sp.]
MIDLFEQKGIHPMLISEMQEPFDDPNFIYELKLDGERCVAYLDGNGTVLQNKRALKLNARFPELIAIHKAAKVKCILDGELAILVDGKPDFSQVQRRSLLSNHFKIQVAMQSYPACFTAFDILYYQDHAVMDRPLEERKVLLGKAVSENGTLALSRYIEQAGTTLYDLAAQQGLEGVVAKRKGSLYYPGKRTKDWIKFKNLKDDDFVVCGFIEKSGGVVSIVLGQYDGDQLIYKGHVTLGVSKQAYQIISSIPISKALFADSEETVWISPVLVCTVKYMEKTASGMLRQPVFKGLRDDKTPKDCRV